MSSSGRKRRHHTVPRFHLKGFASSEGRLRQLDVTTGRQTLVSINDATVIKDFYTVVLPDGSQSDAWEGRIAQVEAEVAPAVARALTATSWDSPSAQDRSLLSTWIALQFLRGPDNRRQQAYLRGLTVQMQVGMGGLEYLQYVMEKGLDRPVSASEARGVWDDVQKPGGPRIHVSGAEHIRTITRMIPHAADIVASRSWHRVRFARRSLAMNDTPVALIPDEHHPRSLGVGLANAGSVTVALDRHTLLLLDRPGLPDAEYPPSTKLAALHNQSVLFGAERFAYAHPEDVDALTASGLPIPRPKRVSPTVQGLDSFANVDRPLEDVLTQIASHDQSDGASMIADYEWPIEGYAPPEASFRDS